MSFPGGASKDAVQHPLALVARSFVLAALLGAALVYFAQFALESPWLVELIKANQLEMANRMVLLESGVIGAALASAVLCAVFAVAWQRHLAFYKIESLLWFASPVLLLPVVPILLRTGAWQDRHDELLLVMVAVLLVAEVLVFRCLRSTPARLIGPWHRAAARLEPFRRYAPLALVIAAALTFAVFVSVYSVRWHEKLGSFAAGPFFGRTRVVLIVQSTLLGLSAIPLFGFARRRISNSAAAVVTLAYLAYYPMHGAAFAGVNHPTLGAFFILTLVWAADTRRFIVFGLSFLALLLLGGDIPIGLCVLGAFFTLSSFRPKLGLLMLVVSLLFIVARPLGEPFGELSRPLAYHELRLGDGLKTLLVNPLFAAAKLADDRTVYYLLHLLVPIAFLPARCWYLWAAFAPGAILTLFARGPKELTDFSSAYVMHFTPYLFLAVSIALASFQSTKEHGAHRMRAALVAMGIASTVLTYNYGAFSGRDNSFRAGAKVVSF